MNYTAVIVAAGRGSRSGLSYNKVLYPCQGRPLLMRSIDLFEQDPACSQIVVVCAPDELADFAQRFAASKTQFCAGGKTRQESVFAGLLKTTQPFVLIHDGARPFASRDLLERLKKALENHPAVVPGIEVVDTIKEIDENGFCVRTPVRAHLRAIQTPQAFSTPLVSRALSRAVEEGVPVTDDAMAVELFEGVKSLCIPGEQTNLKITSPADLEKLEV